MKTSSPTSSIKQLPALAVIAAVLLALAVLPTSRAQERSEQSDQARQIAAELAVVRARLIRENPEAAAIHARILRLYSELDRELGTHPEIQRLRDRLESLRPEPAAPPATDAPVTPDTGDPKP